MSKAVLISIRPEWCEKIASGQKTIEVRKTHPKIDTPFKCYIYCTEEKTLHDLLIIRKKGHIDQIGNGKVIGEFVCDDIETIGVPFPAYQNEMRQDVIERSCLSYAELHRYAGHRSLYDWHISDLVIYDKPKELSEFRKHGFRTGYKIVNDNRRGVVSVPFTCENAPLYRPPQSWCYVEEVT